MRRYGVVVYFGGTCIAMLIAGDAVQGRVRQARTLARSLLVLCLALPLLGLVNVFAPLFQASDATLDALQYLTLRVLQAEGIDRMRITLDVAGYRTRREKTLRQLAQNAAAKVLDTGESYHFEPMSAMERRP